MVASEKNVGSIVDDDNVDIACDDSDVKIQAIDKTTVLNNNAQNDSEVIIRINE